jgi:hypothetical protein
MLVFSIAIRAPQNSRSAGRPGDVPARRTFSRREDLPQPPPCSHSKLPLTGAAVSEVEQRLQQWY